MLLPYGNICLYLPRLMHTNTHAHPSQFLFTPRILPRSAPIPTHLHTRIRFRDRIDSFSETQKHAHTRRRLVNTPYLTMLLVCIFRFAFLFLCAPPG